MYAVEFRLWVYTHNAPYIIAIVIALQSHTIFFIMPSSSTERIHYTHNNTYAFGDTRRYLPVATAETKRFACRIKWKLYTHSQSTQPSETLTIILYTQWICDVAAFFIISLLAGQFDSRQKRVLVVVVGFIPLFYFIFFLIFQTVEHWNNMRTADRQHMHTYNTHTYDDDEMSGCDAKNRWMDIVGRRKSVPFSFYIRMKNR